MPRRRWILAGLVLLVGAIVGLGAPITTASAGPAPVASAPTTTVPPPTTTVKPPTTTVKPIGSQIIPTPATVPFITKTISGSIAPIWAEVSLAGFALVVVFMVVQATLTRSGRRGRRTL